MTRRDDEIIDFEEERSRHAEIFGREDVIERLKGWLTGEHALARGWVLLLGSPGVGKSAIVTRLLDTLPGPTPPHHFIRRGIEGWDRPEVVVQNLCAQIEHRFPNVASADLPAEARLGELLTRLSKNELVPCRERLVLVLDGLDEIAGEGSGKNPLPLFLPRALPWGIVILCASRPVYPHMDWLEQRDVTRRIELDDTFWAASNEAACRAYWEHHATDFSPPLDAEFINEAVRRAEGNLLHAIRLCDWLHDQPVGRRVATQIPQGLSGFLRQLWTELEELPGELGALVMSGLGLACAIRDALPERLFQEVLGCATPREGEAFLRATRPFLRKEAAPWHRGYPAYRLYHECFREFVAQRLGEQVIRDHHRRIASSIAAWPADPGDPLRSAYALRHAVAHRVEAGDLHGAEGLCTNLGYLEAKCRELGVTAALRDLEVVTRAPGADPTSAAAAVLAALSAEALALAEDPSSLAARVYNRLCCAGWSGHRIERELRFPGGPPRLRLLHGVRLGPSQLRAFHGHERSVVACAVTRDGKTFISASADRTLRLWSLGSGECLAILSGHDDELTSCTLVPGDRTALTTSTDATARIWDLHGRRAVSTLDNGGRWATAGVVTPDGERVIVGSDNGVLTVWDRASARRVGSLEGHTDYVTACVVTPEGRYLVSASRDRSVRVWDLGALACLYALDPAEFGAPRPERGAEEAGWITALALHPRKQQILALAGDGSILQWVLDSGRLLQRFAAGQGRIDSCALLGTGRYLLCGMAGGGITVWDIHTARRVLFHAAHAGAVAGFAVAPDGQRFLSASHDRVIKLWDLGAPERLAPQDTHAAPITACAITLDGQHAVSASEDRTLKVWKIDTGAARRTLEGHADLVTACAISADGDSVLSGARDGDVRKWSVESGRSESLEPHGDLVSLCAFIKNGRILTGSRNGTLRLRSSRAQTRIVAQSPRGAQVECFAVTPDLDRVLWSMSREFMASLSDVNTGRVKRTLHCYEAAVLACALSPDAKCAALARDDGILEVHDLDSPRLLHMIPAHEGRIFDCAFSSDGARVFSVSEDRTLKAWSVSTGQCLGTLYGGSWFRCVAASNDRLCAGDQEGNLWIVADDTGAQEASPKSLTPEYVLRSAELRAAPAPAGSPTVLSAPQPPPAASFTALASLREVLASFYGTAAEARIVASDAGLDISRLDFRGSAREFWFAIVREADTQHRLRRLAERVHHDYGENGRFLLVVRELGINL